MAYSAVTQPSPEPFRKRRTPSSTEAVQMTLVWPVDMSTEPSADARKFGSMETGRD